MGEQGLDSSLGNSNCLGRIQTTISSFFNHACDKNVCGFFVPGPRLVMFSTKPIKRGEQV